jgi:pimeloyl-ACP methyl ester carboxylesterase
MIISLKHSILIGVIFIIVGCERSSDHISATDKIMDTLNVVPVTRPDTTGHAEVNGISMYFEIYGEGKPLILLHGGGSTIQTSFGRIIPSLANSRKVIAVELQAHGRTSDRDKPVSFEQDADDVAGLMKVLGVSKADIFGFSNGGSTTMQIAIRHPDLVNKIVVASSFYRRDGMFPGFWDFMAKGTINDMPQSLKAAFLEVTPDSAKLQNLFEKCSQRMLAFKDWDDTMLKAIKARTLIVNGDHDVATSEHVVKMHRLIANSQLLIVPGGHGEYMGEVSFANTESKVKAFVPILDEFLDK